MAAADNQPLPAGLYRHRLQFRARRSSAHPWVYFGTNYPEACKGFAAWKERGGERQTVRWLLDYFTGVVCPTKVKAGQLAPRTARDYSRDAELLKLAFPRHCLEQLRPPDVVTYIEARAPDAPTHVRNEVACLSAALTYAVAKGWIERNPCLDVPWPSRGRRERLITHEEYLTVYQRAHPSVQRAMVLGVRTLANPDDVLRMGPRNLVRRGEERVLRFQRGKTGVWVEVVVAGELARAIDEALSHSPLWPTFVHREDGQAYTVNGIGAMMRRACVGYTGRGKRYAPHGEPIADFGLRDLRAKGATDMYLSGVDIRVISKLLGHKSIRTTEIYLKSLIPEVVRPNEVPIVARAK